MASHPAVELRVSRLERAQVVLGPEALDPQLQAVHTRRSFGFFLNNSTSSGTGWPGPSSSAMKRSNASLDKTRSLVEQRYKAVCELLDGATVTDVARRNGVARQTVTTGCAASPAAWPDWPAAAPRPASCRHQMAPAVEARIVELRRANPGWVSAASCTASSATESSRCRGARRCTEPSPATPHRSHQAAPPPLGRRQRHPPLLTAPYWPPLLIHRQN